MLPNHRWGKIAGIEPTYQVIHQNYAMNRLTLPRSASLERVILVALITLYTAVGCTRSTGDRADIPGTSIANEKNMTAAVDPPSNYTTQVTTWRAEHEERLKSPTGWLALINHYWLKEGVNTIGTSDESDLALPADLEGTPSGRLIVKGDSVTLEVDPDSGFLINGESSTRAELTIDTLLPESDGEDIITIGDRLHLQLVRRADRFAVRLRDKESPAIRDFRGKRWYPVNPAYRVVAEFTPYDPPRSFSIVNVKGHVVPSKLSGKLEFKLHDQIVTLDALVDSPDQLFIVFKDSTSGETTYPPGRFVVTDLPVDGHVILDFNKAYNPPCAFSPHTLCPMPPEQNELDIAIEAGEQLYGEASTQGR